MASSNPVNLSAFLRVRPHFSQTPKSNVEFGPSTSTEDADAMLSRQVPLDIVLRVAHILRESQWLDTLSALHRCSRETYAALLPLLYNRLDIHRGKSDRLLLLSLPDSSAGARVDLDEIIETSIQDDTFFLASNSGVRRLNALRHTRHLTIHSLPSDPISQSFLISSSTIPFPILPRLHSVAIAPGAVDDIRTWIPATYERPRNPPFLEALTRTCQPKDLCIAYRVVTSDEWEEHRDLTVTGQYQFVSRINRLVEDGWTELQSLTVHDIVHQVLPSLPCKNTYHFSSHLVSTPRQPRFLAPGPESTYIPGPSYLYRAWQLGTAIKNLFPSGADSRSVLIDRGTTWSFVNMAGHVLTKLVRDDDDESGVGYDEVDGLIRGSVSRGLPQDLPMREGFGHELVGEVLDRISYGQQKQKQKQDHVACDACVRSGQSVNQTTISRVQDIPDEYRY